MSIEFRPLRPEEVEVRVAQCNEKGCSVLLYKDARVDMTLLDEVAGPENWECYYESIDGKLFCTVSIYIKRDPEDKFGSMVSKQDTGTPSNMEAQKGEASDAFKRACFKWGIGRELYSAPFIWVPADKCKLKQGKNGKWQCYDNFEVTEMEVVDGKIVKLTVVNRSKGGVMVYGGDSPYSEAKAAPAGDGYTEQCKRRMWEAIKKWSAIHGREPEDVLNGVRKRPNWSETPEFFEAVAIEFEQDMNG